MSRGVAAGDFDNLENSLDSCFQKAGFQMRFLHLGWGGGQCRSLLVLFTFSVLPLLCPWGTVTPAPLGFPAHADETPTTFGVSSRSSAAAA